MAYKQVKILEDVDVMLVAIVKDEQQKGRLSVNKQSVVNELIMARHKKVAKSCAKN